MTWKAVFENPVKIKTIEPSGLRVGDVVSTVDFPDQVAVVLRRGERDPSGGFRYWARDRATGKEGWIFLSKKTRLIYHPKAVFENPVARQRAQKVQIVLARTEEDYEVVRPGQSDIGIPAKTRVVLVPKALMWLRKGTSADVAKAEAHAKSEGWRVFTYPTSEKDPLGRAKKDVLR